MTLSSSLLVLLDFLAQILCDSYLDLNVFEAGEMLHVAEAFLDKNYHPTVICRGKLYSCRCFFLVHLFDCLIFSFAKAILFLLVVAYNKALEDAIAVLDKIAMPIDVNDRKSSLFTSISSGLV